MAAGSYEYRPHMNTGLREQRCGALRVIQECGAHVASRDARGQLGDQERPHRHYTQPAYISTVGSKPLIALLFAVHCWLCIKPLPSCEPRL